MSRKTLVGLSFLALGVLTLLRWNPSPERDVERASPPLVRPATDPEELAASAPSAREHALPDAHEPAPAAEAAAPPDAPTIPLRVTDPDGRPLGHASVTVFADRDEGAALFNGRTDPSGLCRVPAPAEIQRARVELAGHCHAHVWLRAEPAEVVLRPARRMTGSVRDGRTRAPVAGARIEFMRDGPPRRTCDQCWPEPVVSDALGNYVLDELEPAPEPVNFCVEAEGYPQLCEAFPVTKDQPALQHDFLLRPGLELAGEVVDHATGAPLERAFVFAFGGRASTDPSGRFRFVASEAGTTLYVLLDGYCGLEVPLVPGAGQPVRIRLVRGARVTGRVLDPDGVPVAWSTVFAPTQPADERAGLPQELGLPPEWRWYSNMEHREAESDADGRFTLEDVLPFQQRLRVGARRDGFRPAEQVLATGAPGETSACELVLEPASSTGTIRGRVTLNGEPAEATVHWQGPTRDGYAWAYAWREGEYRLEHVEPGRIALRVRLGGNDALRDQLSGHEASVDVTAGAECEHDFALELQVAAITGSVRFEDGTPVKGHRLQIRGTQRFHRTPTTDERGVFECKLPLGAGPYDVVTSWAGEQFAKHAVPAGASGLDFVFPASAELRYRVVEAGTALSVRPWAHWRRAGEQHFHLLGELGKSPDADGWLRATVPQGRLELIARSDQHRWTFAPGVLVGAGPVEHVFELAPGHARTFALDPASGPWPADHALVVVEAEAAPSIACEVYPGERYRWTYGDRYGPGMLERRRLDFAARTSVTLGGLLGRQLLLVFPADLVLEPAAIDVDGPRAEPVVVRWRRK